MDNHRRDTLFDLTGRTALVTGGSRGLGLEAAHALANAGATVILNGRNGSTLDEAVRSIRWSGNSAEMLIGDISENPEDLVGRAVTIGGRLDILAHFAAVRDRRSTQEMDARSFREVIDRNLVCSYGLVRAAMPFLTRSGAGRVILVSSIAATIARRGDPAYVASKGGLSALCRALAVEYGSEGVTVNAIAPGLFATSANEKLFADPSMQSYVNLRVPSGRWGRPEEIASAVLFLASPASSYVNGVNLTVDGGLSIQM